MKIAIYTVLTALKYDDILQPLAISDKVDYYCFVKKGMLAETKVGIWNIVEIDYPIDDEIRLSRLPKIQPHETILADYDYTLYIDANVLIKTDFVYKRMSELIQQDVNIALLKHPFRDCAYQELYVCIAAGRGSWWGHVRQIIYMKLHRYPVHNGLYEANLIFRKNCPDVINVNRLWWKYYLRFSKRDQASFMCSLWKNKVKPILFLEDGYTTRNHEGFEKVNHLTNAQSHKQTGKELFTGFITPFLRNLLKS